MSLTRTTSPRLSALQTLSTVNLAEVVGKRVDVGAEAGPVRALLVAAGVTIEPLTAEDAELAGALRAVDGGRGFSPGDRCGLALAARHPSGEALTADRARASLSLPVRVQLIR